MSEIAVAVGVSFNLFNLIEIEHIQLKETYEEVVVNNVPYRLYKGVDFTESEKVDKLLDKMGGLNISVYREFAEQKERVTQTSEGKKKGEVMYNIYGEEVEPLYFCDMMIGSEASQLADGDYTVGEKVYCIENGRVESTFSSIIDSNQMSIFGE